MTRFARSSPIALAVLAQLTAQLSGVAATVVVAPTAAQASKPSTASLDCFADLQRGTSDEIVCHFPLQPSPQERRELEKQSRGYVKNATCTVSIRISRATVMAAVHTPDYVFEAPGQPVQCEVTALWRDAVTVLPISAAFAPKVTIKDGKAIDATPGLTDVKGVSRALSWPVETWVNSGIGIKSNMLQIINAWLDHMRHDAPRKQAQR
jgi:hypothetical protein